MPVFCLLRKLMGPSIKMESMTNFEKLLFEGLDEDIHALKLEKQAQLEQLFDEDKDAPANRLLEQDYLKEVAHDYDDSRGENKADLEEILLKSLGLLAVFRKDGIQNIPLLGIFAFIYIAYECMKSKTGKVKVENLRVVLGIDLPTVASLLSRMGELPPKFIKSNKIKLPVYLKHDKCDAPLIDFDKNYENFLYVSLSPKGQEIADELGGLSVFQFK